MSGLVAHIKKLNSVQGYTKQKSIIDGLRNFIEDSHIKKGENLPSINSLSSDLSCARETVVKAYAELKERGIVQSQQGIGYYVNNEDVNTKMSIALVLYGFQTFQQNFYNTLRKNLGESYTIDVYFHHNNIEVYRSILEDIRLKYGRYIIAPIQSKEAEQCLQSYPSNKILIVDRYQYLGDDVAHITQDFEASLNSIFSELTSKFRSYKKILFFFKDKSDYPKEIKNLFLSYCEREGLNCQLIPEYDSKLLEKKVAYVTIGDIDLWSLIRDAKNANYILGDEIGILSHNDSLVKAIIVGGVTTFSTDFELMAQKAASYIKSKRPIKEIIPIKLILRTTL